MTNHDCAIELAKMARTLELSEADTRHQVIDPLLHDVLGWPRNRVTCEEYIKPGFADYVLARSDGLRLLLIEAKKQGHYFSVPLPDSELSGYVKVRTLLTDALVAEAMQQVREYCTNTGCEFAAITNGLQWIFFKTFQLHQDWRNLRAFVIYDLRYFSEGFTEAYNALSYEAVADRLGMRTLLTEDSHHHRDLFYPKTRVASYDAPVESNVYASTLRPIADAYFGVIDAADSEFMEHCYVSERDYDVSFRNARKRLEDAITPYLERYSIQHTKDGESGGGFARRLQRSITESKRTDVVVLFGGKGVGKSTFLRRLLFHKTPQILKKNAVVANIDLLNASPTDDFKGLIWKRLVECIDVDGVLDGDRAVLCSLFEDRVQQANRQDLFGLDPSSEAYNLRLNALISAWKSEHAYVAVRLCSYWRQRHKAIIVVVDNTDQLPEQVQDTCFAVAQQISAALGSLAVISMREERFFGSSIHGVLDAYQNAGFHITSPSPEAVFLRRFRYVKKLISEGAQESAIPASADTETLSRFLLLLEREFSTNSSHLVSFLTACSHGNIRMALELFRDYVVSGYTNVGEMTSSGMWTIQIHQVIKPFMIPSRLFYDEAKSRIPNIFQIRSKANGSHFTALRILRALSLNQNAHNSPFLPLLQVADPFVNVLGMREDFELNVDLLLRHGLIESNVRLEGHDHRVDAIKITSYGQFMLHALSRAFTYLELTCVDCCVGEEATSNQIAELSNDEYRFHVSFDRLSRIRARLEKADAFIKYLTREEERESALYGLDKAHTFSRELDAAFASQKPRIFKSARRNIGK